MEQLKASELIMMLQWDVILVLCRFQLKNLQISNMIFYQCYREFRHEKTAPTNYNFKLFVIVSGFQHLLMFQLTRRYAISKVGQVHVQANSTPYKSHLHTTFPQMSINSIVWGVTKVNYIIYNRHCVIPLFCLGHLCW